MGTATKLVLIAALAPLGFLLAFFVAVGKGDPKFIGIAIFYPFVLVPTLFFVFLLHGVFREWRLRRGVQALVVIVVGIAGGILVTLLVMTPDLSSVSKIPDLLIRETREALFFYGFWTSWGLGTGLIAWLLYNFGPLKVSPAVAQSLPGIG